MSVQITGTLTIEKSYEGSIAQAVDDFYEEYGTDPESIDGKGFVGTCDGCDAVILEGQTYSESDDDEIRCSGCIDKHQKELAQKTAETAEETPQNKEQDLPFEENLDTHVDEMPLDMQEEQIRDEQIPEESSQPSCNCQHDSHYGIPDPGCGCNALRTPYQLEAWGNLREHAAVCSDPVGCQTHRMLHEAAACSEFVAVQEQPSGEGPIVADSDDPEDDNE
jgi:hypothetical protein